MLAVLGAADMVSVVIRSAFVQLQTPDAMRGRVSAVNSVFIGASKARSENSNPGLTAAVFEHGASILIGGLGTLLVAYLWMRAFPNCGMPTRWSERRAAQHGFVLPWPGRPRRLHVNKPAP